MKTFVCSFLNSQAGRLGKVALPVVFAAGLILGGAPEAHAVPSFARQTGMNCVACHVGSFGPQLTAFGRSFKLNGYVWGDAKKDRKSVV